MNTSVSVQGTALNPYEEREHEEQSGINPNFQDENYMYAFDY